MFKNADKKGAIFLSTIGPQAYKLLSSLMTLAAPGENMYSELVLHMSDHHYVLTSESIQGC